jgi:hypothetical protein
MRPSFLRLSRPANECPGKPCLGLAALSPKRPKPAAKAVEDRGLMGLDDLPNQLDSVEVGQMLVSDNDIGANGFYELPRGVAQIHLTRHREPFRSNYHSERLSPEIMT